MRPEALSTFAAAKTGAQAAPFAAGERIVAALQRKLGARLVETHISWVLLGAGQVWKIKKPVTLPFVDFSTLEARRRMCAEELQLNRRLAPSIYQAIVPVTGEPDDPVLGGSGPAIEWALVMRRFADGALFSERLAAGTLTPALVDKLAERLATFHAAAPRASAGTAYGSPARIAADTCHLLEGLAAHGVQTQAFETWARSQASALDGHWRARQREGWVREGHGDLHLANLFAEGDEATAFDGIEFDPAMRWIDVQADIAFTVMDLTAHGRTDLGFRFLDRWLAATGDHAGLAVLRYYLVYRALVRAMVATLHPPVTEAPDYLGLARHWIAPASGRLLLMHGVSGSGKSTIAEHLLERAGAVRLRSDVERKRLHGLAALARSGAGLGDGPYDAAGTEQTYAYLREAAHHALAAGWPVIVDATFLSEAPRRMFRALADQMRVPFSILHCEAPRDVLAVRLAQRAAAASDASEGGTEVLEHQLRTQQLLAEDELAHVLPLAGDIDALAAHWLAADAR